MRLCTGRRRKKKDAKSSTTSTFEVLLFLLADQLGSSTDGQESLSIGGRGVDAIVTSGLDGVMAEEGIATDKGALAEFARPGRLLVLGGLVSLEIMNATKGFGGAEFATEGHRAC